MIITSNSPGAGFVAWQDVVIKHKNISYSITNGNSDKEYIWWDFTTPTVLQESDTMPAMTDNDAIIIYNDSGTYHLWGEWKALTGLIEVSKIGTPTYDNLQDLINNTFSSGYISGGLITATDPADGTVAISALKGYIKITDSEIAVIKSFDLAGETEFALTNNQTNYIYVWYDAGTPKFAVTTTRADIKTTWMFTIGRVYRKDNVTHIVQSGVQLANHLRKNHERLFAIRRFERASGGAISENGNRFLESQAGIFYIGSNKTITTGKNTNNGDTFTRHYHSGGVWTSDIKSQIAEGGAGFYKYDDGDDLQNLSNNKYGVFWVFIDFDSHLHIVVGRGDYALAEAQAATKPATPNIVSDFAVLAAKIILEEDGVNFVAVQSAYEVFFPLNGAFNHNDLGTIQGGAADDYYHLTQAQHAIASSPEVTGQFIFTVTRTLIVENNATLELFAAATLTLTEVFISVKSAPTGASIIVDVNKNGTTIFTNQGKRPEIVAGETSDTSDEPDVTSVVKNDKLTIDIDQIGSANAGEDLTVHLRFIQNIT